MLDPKLQQIINGYPQPLTIISGYRPPSHPIEAAKNKPGMHAHGKAVDISLAGKSDAERIDLANYLRANGITRFGTYSDEDILHVDLSTANGSFHPMHNRSIKNMADAPPWFRHFTNQQQGAAIPQAGQAGPANPRMNPLGDNPYPDLTWKDGQVYRESQIPGGLLDMQPSLGDNLIMMGEMYRRSGPDASVMSMLKAKQDWKQQLALSLAKGGEQTALQQQLEAAGLTPGTPAYQAAILRYLFKPQTQVNVGGDQGRIPIPQGMPEGTVWKNPEKPGEGVLMPDPNSPTGLREVPHTGSVTTTEGEAKSVGSLNTMQQDLAALQLALNEGASVTGTKGLIAEVLSSPSIGPTVVRDILSRNGIEIKNSTVDALIRMQRLTAMFGQMISGADVPEAQRLQFEKFLPKAGDSDKQIRAKIRQMEDALGNFEEVGGELRYRPKVTVPKATPAPSEAPDSNWEEKLEDYMRRYNIK
jgi:hypothetical protein